MSAVRASGCSSVDVWAAHNSLHTKDRVHLVHVAIEVLPCIFLRFFKSEVWLALLGIIDRDVLQVSSGTPAVFSSLLLGSSSAIKLCSEVSFSSFTRLSSV